MAARKSKVATDEIVAAKRGRAAKKLLEGSVEALGAIERVLGGPLTFRAHLRAIREGEELSLETFAKRLGVARGHLCDVEQGRRTVSAARAARWAEALGYSAHVFVALALQAELDAAGLKLRVSVVAA